MEPAPDAAFSYDEKANLNWALVSLGDKAKEEYDSGEADLPLTGRTSAVLIARELGYRISEISINTNADSKDTIKLYEKALSIIEKIAEAEAEKVSYNGTVHVNTGSSSSLEFKNNNGASDADLNPEDSQPASDNIAIPSSTETEKKDRALTENRQSVSMHQIDAKQTSKPPPSVAPDEENPRPENVRSRNCA